MSGQCPKLTGSQRVFIACPVRDDFIRQELSAVYERVQEVLPQGLSARQETQPHITLRFLGPTEVNHDLKNLHYMLDALVGVCDPIPLRLGGLGTFPGVVKVGIDDRTGDIHALDRLQWLVDVQDHCLFRTSRERLSVSSAYHRLPDPRASDRRRGCQTRVLRPGPL